jgi:iron(III) transport system permease protein
MGGMIFVEGLHLAPLVFLLMVAAFRSMDPSLEESAIMSGAPLRTVVRRITIPLVRPALYAAVLIMVVRTLEAFEVPALLGLPNGTWVFTSRIWQVLDNNTPPAYDQAGAYAMSLLVLTSLGVLWHSRIAKRGRAYQTVTGKGFRPRPVPLGIWRWPAMFLILAYFVVAVIVPLLVVAYASTQQFYSPPTRKTLSHMTLANYGSVLHDDLARTALKNSLILGIGAATAVMLFMAVASWLVVRTQLPGRWVLDNLAFVPLAIPGLVLGVAILFVYLRTSLPIYGTLWILFIAYFTRYMPYGMRYASTSMYQLGRELEESATMSGAGWWQTFRRIVLPLLFPGLLAGWIYILVVSLRELGSSILLYSPGKEVLSIVIWERYQNGELPQLAALGILMVGGLVILVTLAYKLGAKIGIREA